MQTRFYQPTRGSSRSTQGAKPRKARRPKLSKEAHEALRERRRASAEKFDTALRAAWSTIDGITDNLATSHHKSIRRVQSELHMGSLLTRKRHSKTNAWNAFLWKASQEKESGTSHFLFAFVM